MAAEDQILELFDSFWFKHAIFSKLESPQIYAEHIEAHEDQTQEPEVEEIKVSRPRLLRVRSRSYHDLSVTTSFASDSCSPNSVLNTGRKLQTIISGKEACNDDNLSKDGVMVEEEAVKKKAVCDRRNMRKKGCSRSLSDLEYEELKGFMDLGFVFTEEDKKDSCLASIVPGFQRLGRKQGQDDVHEDASEDMSSRTAEVSRPYLSEAWDVMEKKKTENQPLMKWRIPAVNNDIDMKDHLKIWAHTVASTVR